MYIDFSDKDYLPKDEFMILDLLANNNWERPIYFAITVGGSKYLNLQNYFQLEGFAYRLVPIFTGGGGLDRVNFGQVATDIMYDNVMNKFKWGNMNNPKVYIDENNSRMMTNIRNNFNRLASALVQEGKKDSAITVIDKGFELVPTSIVPAEYFSLEMINTLYQAGAKEKASKLAEESFKSYNDMIAYLLSLPKKLQKSGDVDDELQRNLFFMQKLQRICQAFKVDVLEKKINDTMQEYFKRYSGK